jgi:hypothetical protein
MPWVLRKRTHRKEVSDEKRDLENGDTTRSKYPYCHRHHLRGNFVHVKHTPGRHFGVLLYDNRALF